MNKYRITLRYLENSEASKEETMEVTTMSVNEDDAEVSAWSALTYEYPEAKLVSLEKIEQLG